MSDDHATMDELRQLAAFSGWGAVPQVFDVNNAEYAEERQQLRSNLTTAEWNAAARSTINAHFTDPAYVQAIWTAMQNLGFSGGRVLEPGCGTGNFIGLAPEGTQLVGVELDEITANIASQLYPDAEILAESFADTRITGSFDAVVGNVPFSEVRLTDRVHNAAGHSMHNHFLIKSLALTKPGGIVAALTSRYTLDNQNPAARRELAELGDLIGAVRLPTGAHRRTAGTDVVTDLVLLRRREPEWEPDPDTLRWLDMTAAVDVDGTQIRINQYFVDHPEQVLGQLGITSNMYGSDSLVVQGDRAAGPALEAALDRVVAAANDRDLRWSPTSGDQVVIRPAASIGAAPEQFIGHITQTGPDEFATIATNGELEALKVPRTQTRELGHLLQLRDAVTGLLQAEAASLEDTDEIGDLRTKLNRSYDSYQMTYGPLNRFTERGTGRYDEDGKESVSRIRPRVMTTFSRDPFAATVRALEVFDAERQTASKADVLSRRVVAPRRPVLGADSPADALAISIDTYGEPRLDEISTLLGLPETETRAALQGLVFEDPANRRLVSAAEYLSGNVRIKLAAAVTAAADDGRYDENVQALRKVIPEDLGPADIVAQLGAAWIGPDDVQAFLRETLADTTVEVRRIIGAQWKVDGGNFGVNATSEWGTQRFPAGRLTDHVLRQAPIRVYDKLEGGGEILNADETTAAEEKANAIKERFADWVWEDPARADRLARVYNDNFNAIVLRSYDTSHMSLPGLVEEWHPRPHQFAAVARMIAEPTVGLFHEVGAGKTAEMVIGVMEQRRLGLVTKPAIVVPNHMLGQFSREFLQLYPQARILAAGTEDLVEAKRRDFVARVTTGNWDAIIMTRTAFEKLPVSKATLQRYMSDEIEPLREARDTIVASGDSRSVKQVEKAIQTHEERIKKKLDTVKDAGVTFEQTGIDYLCVDELHDYKNLFTASRITDAAITPGSVRASDLHMKIEYLRTRHNGRAFTGATATPIANSISEAYVMQRYLRPDLLIDAGITDFDTWAGTFGQVETAMEIATDATSSKLKTRFARFKNTPELLQMWHVAGDVKTAKDLNLPVPDIAPRSDGQRLPENVVVEPTAEVQAYMANLGKRSEQVQRRAIDPTKDNMLKISSDGRAAALDLRLVKDATAEDATYELLELMVAESNMSKVDVVADNVADLWAANKDRVYLGADGMPHPRTGALQIVFCDLGTPRKDWNVYDEIKDLLIERGVPGEQIEFIHSARNDREKDALFEAARTGRIQVLLGSTGKMGTGTNIQDRAIAIHNVDCPWRPADIVQRIGRAVRQGNQNPEVAIRNYITKGTFDAVMWQKIEQKATFINDFLSGRIEGREVDDIGDLVLSASESKALSSGNPLLLEKATADREVARLISLQRSHDRDQHMLKYRIEQNATNLAGAHRQVQELEVAIARRVDTRGDKFRMQVADRTYSDRGEAARALTAQLHQVLNAPYGHRGEHPVGNLGSYPLVAERKYRDTDPIAVLRFEDAPAAPIVISVNDTQNPAPGLIVRCENVLRTFERTLGAAHQQIEELTTETARANAKLGQPFKYREQLHAAYGERKRINDALAAQASPPPAPAAATDPDVAESLALLGSTNPGASGPQNKPASPTAAPAIAERADPSRDSSPGLD